MDSAVGDGGEVLVVGDDDKGLTELVAQVEKELVELGLVLGVETTGGFVGEDDGRMVDKGSCYGDALFLTTGELVGLMSGAVSESHEVKQFHGALL